MRLIDADALLERMRKDPLFPLVERYGVSGVIDSEPTVEPKTGMWEMKPDPYGFFDDIPVCSECGCTTKMREVYKFCPNCGASMVRGEE